MDLTGPSPALHQPKSLSQNACLPCRSVKMKCRREPSSVKCERCIRKSMDCVFEKHRRGRKPGTRLVRKTEPSSPSKVAKSQSYPPQWNGDANSYNDESMIEPELRDQATPYPTGAPDDIDHTKTPWDNSNTLEPAELLNKNARTGKFSLQNVLSTETGDDPEDNCHPQKNHSSPENYLAYSVDDPIRSQILNFPIALGLFDSFMRSLNPFISQFDPKLHTFEYVQLRSPFLLTSILAAAARAFHPPLHSALRAHTEHLLAKAFSQGSKSPETVQAILVSTYWKEPDDTRSWLLVGYAIRMCIEMGWHKLGAMPASQDRVALSQIREEMNIRRTWLILFVYDRSISLQMGKPYMIDQNDFISSAQNWYTQPYAVFGADAILSAFVTLRIISSEILELVSPDRSSRHIHQGDNLMKLLNSNITRWEEHWFPISEDERVDRCQAFLIRFYGTHLRLLLNSYALQQSLNDSKNGTTISKQAVWTCYSSAIDMLKQISDKFGPLKLLYFAQDSVHVMTAYAAVLLIKLLLSLPAHISSEFEAESIEAIRKTARTFDSQCATQKTGCALQARFLNNVVGQYENVKRQPPRRTLLPKAKTQAPTATSQQYIYNSGSAAPLDPHPNVPQTAQNSNDQHMSSYSGSVADSQDIVTTSHDGFYTVPPTTMGYEMDVGNWNFGNNDAWEQMFATAGYRIHDGVFMPGDGMSGN